MKILSHLSIFLISVLAISCTTSHKVIIFGQSGSEIYRLKGAKFYLSNQTGLLDTDKEFIGKIGMNGILKLKLPADDYFGILYSKSAISNVMIPFALDTKTKTHKGSLFLEGMSFYVPPILGFAYYLPLYYKNSQTSYLYQFAYKKHQTTNEDITFAQPLPMGPPKKIVKTTVEMVKEYPKKTQLEQIESILFSQVGSIGQLSTSKTLKIKSMIIYLSSGNYNFDYFEGEGYLKINSDNNVTLKNKSGTNTYKCNEKRFNVKDDGEISGFVFTNTKDNVDTHFSMEKVLGVLALHEYEYSLENNEYVRRCSYIFE